MLGSIVVALVTVSLLFVGVYLGSNQDVAENTEEVGSYDEGFFGSLNSLVGGLQDSAQRGEETRENRYQEYLKVQQKGEEANARLQRTSKAYQTQTTTVPATNTTEQNTDDGATPSLPTPTPPSSNNDDLDFEDLGDEDLFLDLDYLDDLDF